MRKMLVITRNGNRSEEISDLLDQDDKIQNKTAPDSAEQDDDREVDM